MKEAAARFLRSINYRGLVEIEFKYDSRDARYKLLDANARAWAWIELGSIAGIDFGHLTWQLAMGEPIEPPHVREQVAWMHLSRDLIAAAQEIISGSIRPADYVPAWRNQLVLRLSPKMIRYRASPICH